MYGSSNYIVPKVDDQGIISGTYLMYNSTGYETPKPVKLKSDQDYIDSFQRFKTDKDLGL
jgi:hypothetical protein